MERTYFNAETEVKWPDGAIGKILKLVEKWEIIKDYNECKPVTNMESSE